ncbi:MAG: aminoacyl-tRNA hydrolase [Candidatus Gracilibacteria bacterium]
MKLIVGLGNPGKEYETTRHNAGFMAVDFLQKKFSLADWKIEKSMKAELTKGSINGTTVILAKPTTYMNLSGESVVAIKNFYKIEEKDILIVFDDVDLPIETLRFREKGSAGTHNGMRSIVQLLGSEDFPRLKIGIQPSHKIKDLSSYVLGRMTEDELAALGILESSIESQVEKFLEN